MHVFFVKYHHIIPTVYWSNMTYQVCQQSDVPRRDSQALSVPVVVSLHQNVLTMHTQQFNTTYTCYGLKNILRCTTLCICRLENSTWAKTDVTHATL